MDLQLIQNSPLSEKDKALIQKFIEHGLPNIGKVSDRLIKDWFELFVQGKSARDIHRNNAVFPLEVILYCQIKYNWDQLREEYINELQKKTMERLMQIRMESVNFAVDLLNVAHKQHGEKLQKYLQSGNDEDLPEMAISSIAGYQKVLETLIKAVEGAKKSKEEGTPLVAINVGSDAKIEANTKINVDNAEKLLEILANNKKQ